MWMTCLLIATAVLCLAAVSAIIRGRSRYVSGRVLDTTKILFVGVMLSAVVVFIPICLEAYRVYDCGVGETLLFAVSSMFNLFMVDGDYEFAIANLDAVSGWVLNGYRVLLGILFVSAPLLTFGVVLSFFKNLSAHWRFVTDRRREVIVFSELNERSLTLANDLHDNAPDNRLLVFTDVFEKNEESSYEQIERAKELGAVCYKKDITMIDFVKHKKKAHLRLFVIGSDRAENSSQSIRLLGNLKHRPHTDLYMLSEWEEDELFLVNALKKETENEPEAAVHVRCINEVTSLVHRTLYTGGYEAVFRSSRERGDGVRVIHAVVVGLGAHGTEMLKALAWFCQMDGYEVHIHAYDADPDAEDRFRSLCPELMADHLNGRFDIAGEAGCEICIHAGVDVMTKTFDDAFVGDGDATYVFVATGEDERNLRVAMKLRMLSARRRLHPVIQAVVHNSAKKETLHGIGNYKLQPYDIEFIGDLKTTFSEEVILNSELEEKALARHLKWGKSEEAVNAFWRYSYHYKSSVASAIHHKMKILCGIPGADKAPAERTATQREALRVLEHCRWNAYMRSEGYVYSGSVDPTTRYDLAKMHHCLVPFAQLPKEEQIKDDD